MIATFSSAVMFSPFPYRCRCDPIRHRLPLVGSAQLLLRATNERLARLSEVPVSADARVRPPAEARSRKRRAKRERPPCAAPCIPLDQSGASTPLETCPLSGEARPPSAASDLVVVSRAAWAADRAEHAVTGGASFPSHKAK